MTRETVLVTGGAGFVGANLADRLARDGADVIVYDALSRPGVGENVDWLKERHGDRIVTEIADVRDRDRLTAAVRRADRIYHLAAQVAVTTSLADPIGDYETNLGGTLNLLEAIRAAPKRPPLVFASTNKVYGKLGDMPTVQAGRRHRPVEVGLAERGVPESQPLDFYSPYGCSKGAADQYVVDYARIYGLDTVVFRMSCLYGPRQFGTEDQGWVAHFLISTLAGRGITIFGDGLQVRDVLFVDDVVDAFLLAQREIEALRGRAFNIGGGPRNAVSLVEILDRIEGLAGRRPELAFADWRPGDQLWYVSDTRAFGALTGWRPKTDVETGLRRLFDWLSEREATRVVGRATGVAA